MIQISLNTCDCIQCALLWQLVAYRMLIFFRFVRYKLISTRMVFCASHNLASFYSNVYKHFWRTLHICSSSELAWNRLKHHFAIQWVDFVIFLNPRKNTKNRKCDTYTKNNRMHLYSLNSTHNPNANSLYRWVSKMCTFRAQRFLYFLCASISPWRT